MIDVNSMSGGSIEDLTVGVHTYVARLRTLSSELVSILLPTNKKADKLLIKNTSEQIIKVVINWAGAFTDSFGTSNRALIVSPNSTESFDFSGLNAITGVDITALDLAGIAVGTITDTLDSLITTQLGGLVYVTFIEK